jgi:hypothetical protein
MRRAVAAIAMMDRRDAVMPVAAPVNFGDDGAEIVVLGLAVPFVPGTRAKFAQVMRVVLAKWTTRERLPA